jgi:hypothetical protein
MKVRGLFVILMFFMPIAFLAAQKVFPGEPWTIGDENLMTGNLKEGGKLTERLVSLGVGPEIAGEYSGLSEDDLKGIQWRFLDHERHRIALLFLPCSATDSANLLLLIKEDSGWKINDQFGIDCHYDSSAGFEIGRIRDSKIDEIVVHHACFERGTGYLEQHFLVLFPSGGKLKLELDTREVVNDDQPQERRKLDQQSIFTVIPVGNSRTEAIEETRSSVLNGRLTVKRRIFRWDSTEGKYRPSAFTKVVAAK